MSNKSIFSSTNQILYQNLRTIILTQLCIGKVRWILSEYSSYTRYGYKITKPLLETTF